MRRVLVVEEGSRSGVRSAECGGCEATQTRSGSGTQSSPGARAGDSLSRELRARAGKCWATIRYCGDYCDDMMTKPVNTTHPSEVRVLTCYGRGPWDKIEMSPAAG